MLVITAAAVCLVLLLVTHIGESTEPSYFVGAGYNMSYVYEDGNLVGLVNITWDNGDIFSGEMFYSEEGYMLKNGPGMDFYGMSGVTVEANYEMDVPVGSASLKMPLPSALENATLAGCSGCIQVIDEDGQWWFTVNGDSFGGYGWIYVTQNASLHQAYAYSAAYGFQYGFGPHNNESQLEGKGFSKAFQSSYNYTGALMQECSAVEGFPKADEEKLGSKLPKPLTSYWTNNTFYEGEFDKGKPHGMGSMTLFSGEIIEGQFYMGKPMCTATVSFGNEKNCKQAANQKKVIRKPKTFAGVCSGTLELKAFFVGGVPGIWLKN